MGNHADFHVKNESDYLRLIELARDLDRNNMVVGQGITRLINNVLQDGIKVDPQTGDDELNRILSKKWKDWSEDPERCDVAGEHALRKLAEIALRCVVVDGDIIPLLTAGGKIQHIEAHRVRRSKATKKNVVGGFLLDAVRRRLEVWIAPESLSPYSLGPKLSEMRRVPIRDGKGQRQVLHVYNPRRISQTRGVTHLAAVADTSLQIDDLMFSKLVQAQAVSCFAILREMSDEAPSGTPPGATGTTETETLADGKERTIQGIAPGLEIMGRRGEKISGFSPSVPNAEFFEHAALMLSILAINLDLPVVAFLMDATKTNFSGWRGAMDQAKVGFRAIQKWMIERFYEPLYQWKMRQFALDDDVLAFLQKSDVDFLAHRWNPPSWPYIEPAKDAKADQTRLDSRLISQRRVHAERGRDWDEVSAEIVEDNAQHVGRAILRADEINTAHPDAALDWRELAAMPAAGKKQSQRRAATIDDVSKAVRSGVRIGEGEARAILGLSAEPADGRLARFNDADVLQYHVDNPILTINEIRVRLGEAEVAWGNQSPMERKLELEKKNTGGQATSGTQPGNDQPVAPGADSKEEGEAGDEPPEPADGEETPQGGDDEE